MCFIFGQPVAEVLEYLHVQVSSFSCRVVGRSSHSLVKRRHSNCWWLGVGWHQALYCWLPKGFQNFIEILIKLTAPPQKKYAAIQISGMWFCCRWIRCFKLSITHMEGYNVKWDNRSILSKMGFFKAKWPKHIRPLDFSLSPVSLPIKDVRDNLLGHFPLSSSSVSSCGCRNRVLMINSCRYLKKIDFVVV